LDNPLTDFGLKIVINNTIETSHDFSIQVTDFKTILTGKQLSLEDRTICHETVISVLLICQKMAPTSNK